GVLLGMHTLSLLPGTPDGFQFPAVSQALANPMVPPTHVLVVPAGQAAAWTCRGATARSCNASNRAAPATAASSKIAGRLMRVPLRTLNRRPYRSSRLFMPSHAPPSAPDVPITTACTTTVVVPFGLLQLSGIPIEFPLALRPFTPRAGRD